MKFLKFPVVRFALFLGAGIAVAHFFPTTTAALPFLLLSLVTTIVLWILFRNRLIQKIYFGLSVLGCFFLLGYFNYQIRLPQFRPDHYSHFIEPNQPALIQLKISETLKEDNFSHKYFAKVLAVNGLPHEGKILLNIRKDSLSKMQMSDDVLLVNSEFLKIPESVNPYQFEYSEYLKTENVYHQMIVFREEILSSRQGSTTFFGAAQNFRSSLVEKLRTSSLTKDERAIIQALVLGEKKDISKELYQQYAAAGAVHILAVSGLHVGILFTILSFLLHPLTRFKNGKIIRSVLIVFLLWAFAFLAGLSPSVMRAVCMFSFFAVALIFQRKTSGINTLFLSFLFLTLLNPMNLFKVGFQLSYSAVFFILWLNPFFRNLTYSRFRIWREAKSIIAVTLSAQLGVLPLTLYYFHQFPGMFLLTNLVVLPLLTIYMAFGIGIVFLSYFGILPEVLALLYNGMVEMLNNFVRWVAHHDKFLLKDIHFSGVKAIGLFLFLFAFGLFLQQPGRQRRLVVTAAFIFLLTTYLWEDKKSMQTEFVVFHKSRETIIAYKNGRHLTIFMSDSSKTFRSYPFLTAYISEKNSPHVTSSSLPGILTYKDRIFLIVDSSGVIPSGNFDYLILTGSPKINLERIPTHQMQKGIIADGSSFPSYISRWEESAKKRKLLFHHTAKEGAFSIE